MLESEVENPVCNYAEKIGYTVFKLQFISFVGAPDRLFIREGGVILFIEFKRPGKTERKRQGFVHQLLKQSGLNVYVMDNKEKAIEILNFHAKELPEKSNKRRNRK